ncbi:MAG: dTDP-4-dehydrorhamnose 3,5-epimerase family protein, partial [Gammaproteobacteria bacterium]
MEVIATKIPDVLLLKPTVFEDGRGFFMETFNAENFATHGLPTEFVQDNHSGSSHNVLRG